MKSVDLITLGCSKNLVDSERVMKMLTDAGFECRHDPQEGSEPSEIIIVNTCGFINDAKEESINTILGYCAGRSEGKIRRLIVMGCLSQRYNEQLPPEIPEVDAWYGKFEWDKLVADLVQASLEENPDEAGPVDQQGKQSRLMRQVTTGPSHAYIKIAEGCDRFCAFCAIPIITGRFHSRPIEEIVAEVKALTEEGFSEFNIIAQDLSSYGKDRYGRHSLAELIEAITAIDAVKWVRLHYAYPADFPYDILTVMRENPKVCKYLDIALQHISDPVLENMRRHFSSLQTKELIARIRKEVPGIHVRTTLMVGFPGEGESEFEELMNFIEEARFERMGAFAYCEEEDTFAARNFIDSIPAEEKERRLGLLMARQEEISLEIQQQKVDTIIEVVIDREDESYYVGRTQWDSPEVDPEVLIEKKRKLKPGNYYNVRVKSALPFELIAEPV